MENSFYRNLLNRWVSALKQNSGLSKIKDQKEAERKFHDWFGEFAVASRNMNAAKSRVPVPFAAKLLKAIFKPLDLEKQTGFAPISDGLQAGNTYPQNPESSAIFRQMVFLKYGITFRDLIHQIDIEKNPRAHRKLMAVHRDFWRLQSGRRFENLKLKFSYKHFQILADGFDFGVDKLTPDELADCLDEICPCGQKHSPEYLKKLRTRIKQACRDLF